MTNRDPKYRCLICEDRRVVRRIGKHSNHFHDGKVAFEKVGTAK